MFLPHRSKGVSIASPRMFLFRLMTRLKSWYGRHYRQSIQNLQPQNLDRIRAEEESISTVVVVPKDWQEEVFSLRQEFHKKFSRFVLWGLKDKLLPDRFIHRGYYLTAKKLGLPTVWLEDRMENNALLRPGDLLMVLGDYPSAMRYVSTVLPRPDVYYCFYRTYRDDIVRQLQQENYLLRQEYRNHLLFGLQTVDTIRISQTEGLYYNPTFRFLCQPYGTDLLPWEFRQPVFNPTGRNVNYVGTRWRSNEDSIKRFDKYLRSVRLKFQLHSFVTLAEHIDLIRQSRLAPALGGLDVGQNYPHCRMFKNISYGQLGYTDIPIHQDLYSRCHPPLGSLEEMSDYVLSMSEDDYISMTEAQQKITRRFTFLQHLANIFKYF